MKAHRPTAIAPSLVALIALAAGVQARRRSSPAPLSGASTVQIFPNILFVLDDSVQHELHYSPIGRSAKDYQIPEVRTPASTASPTTRR
jgi:hypothetical protein